MTLLQTRKNVCKSNFKDGTFRFDKYLSVWAKLMYMLFFKWLKVWNYASIHVYIFDENRCCHACLRYACYGHTQKEGKLGNVRLRNQLLCLSKACGVDIPRQRFSWTWWNSMTSLYCWIFAPRSASWKQSGRNQWSVVLHINACNFAIESVVVWHPDFSKQTQMRGKATRKSNNLTK